MDNFIQITVFCPPEPRVGAFVYRNAGKIYSWSNWNVEVSVILEGKIRRIGRKISWNKEKN